MEDAGLEKGIGLAKEWLLNSGIQSENGAFNAWFDCGSESWPFAYSEITGYGITTLAFLHGRKREKILLSRAEKAAQWIEKEATTADGAVKTRLYYDTQKSDKNFCFEEQNVFAFDNGMVINGLVNLFNATGEKKYLEEAEKIALFLTQKMWQGNSMCAVSNLKTGSFLDCEKTWSWQPGSYHAKIAIGLAELGEITGNNDFSEKAIALCENAIAMQQENGRFVTNRKDNSTHLHPHCYSAEGLLYVGKKFGEEKFCDAAAKAVGWAVGNIVADNGIRAFFDGKWNESQRSDTIAQLLRLYCAANSGCAQEKNNGAGLEKAIGISKRLLEFQNASGKQKGGFFYGKELDGSQKNCLNSWCTMFALQALCWFQDFECGKEISVDFLV